MTTSYIIKYGDDGASDNDGDAERRAKLESGSHGRATLREKYQIPDAQHLFNIITMRTGKIWQKRGAREAKAGADPFSLMKKMEQTIRRWRRGRRQITQRRTLAYISPPVHMLQRWVALYFA